MAEKQPDTAFSCCVYFFVVLMVACDLSYGYTVSIHVVAEYVIGFSCVIYCTANDIG